MMISVTRTLSTGSRLLCLSGLAPILNSDQNEKGMRLKKAIPVALAAFFTLQTSVSLACEQRCHRPLQTVNEVEVDADLPPCHRGAATPGKSPATPADRSPCSLKGCMDLRSLDSSHASAAVSIPLSGVATAFLPYTSAVGTNKTAVFSHCAGLSPPATAAQNLATVILTL